MSKGKNQSGCSFRIAGKAYSSVEGIERTANGKVQYHQPRSVGIELENRVFCLHFCPRKIKEQFSGNYDLRIPMRPGRLEMLKLPRHRNLIFFYVPNYLSVKMMMDQDIWKDMFGDMSGLHHTGGDYIFSCMTKEPAWSWILVSRNPRITECGDLSLSAAIYCHLIYRNRIGDNLFISPSVICNDKQGRPVTVGFDHEGKITISNNIPVASGYANGVTLNR